MTRKKVIEDVSEVSAAEKLADDEEIIISDVRTIKRGRKPPPMPEPDEEPDGLELIEVEPEPEDAFPEGTIGHLLSRSEDERFRHTQCDILVVRKPDSAGEKFLKPCVSRISEAPLRNIDLNQSQSEIEELVRTYYGGGHYYLQVKIGNQMQTGWSCDLADAPDAVARARTEQFSPQPNAAPTPEALPPVPAANPLDQFFDAMEKQSRLKDLLFGEEKRRLELEIERLRSENANRQPTNQSDLALLLSVLKEKPDPSIIEFAKDYLSPENQEGKFGIWDFAKYVFDNKEQVGGLASRLLGGMMPSQPRPPAGGIEALLKQQPPTATPPPERPQPLRSTFQRRTVAVPTELNDNDNSDTAGMEAAEPDESDNKPDQME